MKEYPLLFDKVNFIQIKKKKITLQLSWPRKLNKWFDSLKSWQIITESTTNLRIKN